MSAALDAPSLSLIIPAYNEQAGICQAIAEADRDLQGLGYNYEILVIDDGSSDETANAVVNACAGRRHIRLIRHPHNRGYGAALRTGFEQATKDLVAFTDADCQFHLSDLAELVEAAHDHPIAVGYRVKRQDPWRRRFFSWGYNLLVRALLGTRVRDCDCALKVFRRETLAQLLPRSRGFFVNAEILATARRLGCHIAEVGVRHRPRLAGKSKVSILDIPPVLWVLLPFWWSSVLFPATSAPAPTVRLAGRGSGRGFGLSLIALVVMAALLFFSRLRSPLLEPEEARYAEIPRQMLSEGRFIMPVYHGEPYLQKPPLLYWLIMASYRVFGIHDWAARLVPCTAAFATVVVVYFWGRRTIGCQPALMAALVLLLSGRFVYMGRMVSMDSVLTLWIVAAWACGHRAMFDARRPLSWWLIAACSCGLGVLTKGPVALVLIGPPIILQQMLDRRAHRMPLRYAWPGLAVLLAVAAPWYVAVAAQQPSFLSDFFYRHNLLRYVTPFDHEEPFWYYIPLLFAGMLPWTLLLPAWARWLTRKAPLACRNRPAALGFYLLCFLGCFAFYSAAGCKRPGYILPAMPPLALCLGWYLHISRPRHQWSRATTHMVRLTRLPHQATLLVLAGGVLLSFLATGAGITKPSHGLPLGVLFLTALVLIMAWRPHGRLLSGWSICAIATFLLLLAGLHELLPGYARKFSLRTQVVSHVALDPRLPVICYPHRWDSVNFYLQRGDVQVYAGHERSELIAALRRDQKALLFVKSERYLPELLRALPASLEFEPVGKAGIVTGGIIGPRLVAPLDLMAAR
jgi:dolichol-phosphate mannosyltransferase